MKSNCVRNRLVITKLVFSALFWLLPLPSSAQALRLINPLHQINNNWNTSEHSHLNIERKTELNSRRIGGDKTCFPFSYVLLFFVEEN